MISIIICSRNNSLNPVVKGNIEDTIGIEHEVILIDNSDTKYSIFQAYNQGVNRSRFPYLCFMHDDIMYHTKNWGLNVLKHFEDEKTGAIGIAGSPYAAFMPGSWWSSGLVNEIIIPKNSNDLKPVLKYFPAKNPDKNEVVVLDGVWMCIRRSLFEEISFDETLFDGFHFYDIDISLQINKLGYKLFCIFNVELQHFSSSVMNNLWLQNALKVQKKWGKQLPVQCVALTYAKSCEVELKTFDEYLDVLLINGIAKVSAYKLMMKELLKFRKGYLYYKNPLYFLKFIRKISFFDQK